MKKNKIIKILITILAAASVAVCSGSCYNPGDAVVTIHIERNDLAAMGITPEPGLSIIDRVLNFFSTRAEAGASWSDIRTDIILTVTSDSFDEKTFTLPADATSFSTILPSGCVTEFTIRSWHLDGSTSKDQVYWGGRESVYLGPGEQNIIIQMKPMSWIWSLGTSTGSVYISWVNAGYQPLYTPTSYNIYRSSNIDGIYDKIASNVTSFTDSFATGIISGNTYYYKISTNSIYGESIQSEPAGPITVL